MLRKPLIRRDKGETLYLQSPCIIEARFYPVFLNASLIFLEFLALIRLSSALHDPVPCLPSLGSTCTFTCTCTCTCTCSPPHNATVFWGVGSCGCGCWLLVGVTPSLASSAPPLLSLLPLDRFLGPLYPLPPLDRFLGPLYPLPSSLSSFPLSFSPLSLFCPRPVLTPIPVLVLILVPVSPVPVPVTVSSLPSLVTCSPLGNTSSRRRVLRPKLLATCRRHLLSTGMTPRA